MREGVREEENNVAITWDHKNGRGDSKQSHLTMRRKYFG